MSMSNYSDDDDDDDEDSSETPKRPHDRKSPLNGSAFAEVVRATMKAKEEEQSAAPAGGH